uniref:EVE domain-containing protein n=2 Tax=Thermorudis TaxID=1649508 RepID=A0A7C2ZYC8_9BACT
MAERGYWIVVGSPENFEATRQHGFTVQGFKSRHRKKAEQMKPGDKLVYYLTGEKAFAAIATVTSTSFEDHTPIWRSKDPKKQAEDYPWRVKIEPEIVLPEGEHVPAEPVARQMQYTRKWPAEHWTLAFQGNLHRIDEGDFELIRKALLEAHATVA